MYSLVLFTSENLTRLIDAKLGGLLYCASLGEMAEWIDWFEAEDCIDSLSYQFELAMTIIQRENTGKAVIRNNLDQEALQYFDKVVKDWQDNGQGHDTVPRDVKIIIGIGTIFIFTLLNSCHRLRSFFRGSAQGN